MTVELAWIYLGAFAGAALLCGVFTPLALRVAVRRQVMDRPGGHKSHTSPVPYLGGVAIVVAFSLAVIVASLLRPPVGGFGELVVILGLALAVSLVGLVDDLRGLPAWVRLLVVTAAAVGIWAVGISVSLFAGGGVAGGEWIDLAITLVWIVGITNAFNLLDNMDGLSAGVAAIGAFFFFLIAALHGQFLVAALAIALVGCALGFLRHNFHPATIYMGDAGSLFLGFVLAVLGIKLAVPTAPVIAAFVPILVLAVAILDTALVTAARIHHRRSPFAGGRDHVSHRLVHVGIPVPIAVGLIYGTAVGAGWLGVVMARLTDLVTAYLLLGFTLAVGVSVAVLLGMVPVYETSTRQRMMLRKVVEHEVEPERAPAEQRETADR